MRQLLLLIPRPTAPRPATTTAVSRARRRRRQKKAGEREFTAPALVVNLVAYGPKIGRNREAN